MQTLEEEESETEDKLVSPPSASLSGLWTVRLQIDSDVLIYVLMIGLVCNLCSAMPQSQIPETGKHTWTLTHIGTEMKELTQ